MSKRRLLLALALLATACKSAGPGSGTSPGPAPAPADLVVWNGRIVTLEDDPPEVEALAARDGRIVALGSRAEVQRLVGDTTEVLDLAGAFAMPGFIEGHGHFLGIGDMRVQLDLRAAPTWEAIVDQVEAAVAAAGPGELVRGRGWHQEKWSTPPVPSVQGSPVHASLSAVSPDNPVILRHASGHAAFVNARALELAGITRDTPDPPGGEIVHAEDGAPTGLLRETAMGLLAPVLASATPPDPRRLARLAAEECLRKGVTSFQDAGSPFETVDLFRELADEGALGVRLWVMVRDSNDRLAARMDDARTIGYGHDHLTVRAIKHSIDGALGSHGAWLLAPYADLPGSSGLNTTPLATIEESARLALAHDYQLCVHAIGDRANRETLDLYERAFAGRADARELRWRIEHAQHLHPDDVPRFAELGVIASMQAVHCTSDAPFVPPRLGDARAASGAYLWRALRESGAVVTNGTDAPVEDVDPLPCYHAMITRELADGSRFYPAQCLSRLEALRAYTIAAAYAAFEEDVKGTLAPGKLADLTVVSRDLLDAPEDELADARVLATIVGGEVVYRAGDS